MTQMLATAEIEATLLYTRIEFPSISDSLVGGIGQQTYTKHSK